jgi:uncharacterized protein
MQVILTEIETRVLGSLIEKDITTPDYYPMSLNALVNACNQKNNRDPVMTLDESAVRDALSTLQEKRLAGPASGADSRVPKFEHRLQEVFNFDRREIAVICVLLLRGPQTPGELRSRTDRMYHFDALEDVVSTLDRLAQREPPLAAMLPRQPGTKESRYMHLFSGEPPADAGVAQVPSLADAGTGTTADRIAKLEDEHRDGRPEESATNPENHRCSPAPANQINPAGAAGLPDAVFESDSRPVKWSWPRGNGPRQTEKAGWRHGQACDNVLTDREECLIKCRARDPKG